MQTAVTAHFTSELLGLLLIFFAQHQNSLMLVINITTLFEMKYYSVINSHPLKLWDCRPLKCFSGVGYIGTNENNNQKICQICVYCGKVVLCIYRPKSKTIIFPINGY